MATYSTNEFKSGLKIMMDGDPCAIIENEFVKPGKGQAFNRVKIRNLKTGRVIDRTFKSGESVEGADVVDTEMQYLYADGEFWHFMTPDTFEQFAAPFMRQLGMPTVLCHRLVVADDRIVDYRLRQAAIRQRIAYTTTMSAASAASDAILSLRSRRPTVRSLQEWQQDILDAAAVEV